MHRYDLAVKKRIKWKMRTVMLMMKAVPTCLVAALEMQMWRRAVIRSPSCGVNEYRKWARCYIYCV